MFLNFFPLLTLRVL